MEWTHAVRDIDLHASDWVISQVTNVLKSSAAAGGGINWVDMVGLTYKYNAPLDYLLP